MARPINVIDQPPPMAAPQLEETFMQGGGPLSVRTNQEIVAERSLFGDVMTAQPVKVARDESKVLSQIKTMAAAAGERWYYRFPVWNNRKRRQEHIEGISIQGTDSVARYYGNCRVESAVVDMGACWMIYSRFVDLQTGYTLIRPFKADKDQSTLKTDDKARLEQIALGTAVSKGQRIVVDHALNDFTTFAFEEAKRSNIGAIGAKLAEFRANTLEHLERFEVPGLVARVEQAYGRKAGEWSAADVAAIRAEIRAINGGLESIDNTWPPPVPAEPKRSDDDATNTHTSAPEAAAPFSPAAAGSDGQAGNVPHAEPDFSSPPPLWIIGDNVIGLDAIIKAAHALLEQAKTAADVDAIEQLNADKIAKFGRQGPSWRLAVHTKRAQLGGSNGGTNDARA